MALYIHREAFIELHSTQSHSQHIIMCKALRCVEETMVIDTVPVLDRGFPGSLVVKNLPAIARDLGDVGSISGLGRSPGGENANPFYILV